MSGAEVRDAMLGTALALVEEHGLTVSLDHISMDAIVAESGVARSAAYRVWPRREEFIVDLLLQLAASPKASPALYDSPALRIALNTLVEHRSELITEEDRRKVLVEVARAGSMTNFDDVRRRSIWKTHLALSATILSFPDEHRRELQEALDTANEAYIEGMARFYKLILRPVGVEPVPGTDHRDIAASGSAIMEGIVVRSLTAYNGRSGLPDLVKSRHTDPFDTGVVGEWNPASIAFTSNLLALTRPIEGVSADEIDTRLKDVSDLIDQLELAAEESNQWVER